MPSAAFTIAALNDEGFEEVIQGNSGGAWGTLVLAGSGSGPATDYHAGWRWVTTVPQGATINSATLKLRARDALTGALANIHLAFFGNDVDSAGDWTSTTLVPTTMPPTTAKVDYDPVAWVPDDYYNFDITSVVQEIVSRGGFSGTLAVALMNDGTTGDNSLSFYRFGDGDTESGKITIDYTAGGGGGGGTPDAFSPSVPRFPRWMARLRG